MVLIILMMFNLYPFWMQQAIWSAFCYYCLSYLAIGGARLAFYMAGFHLGVRFWLFPNFRKSYNIFKFMWPVASAEMREDMWDFKFILFRIASLGFIVRIMMLFLADG